MKRIGFRHLFHGRFQMVAFAPVVLMLSVDRMPAHGQNTASLTIQGVMPAAQRLSISPLPSLIVATNQIFVTVEAKNNVAAGYAISIQSKTPSVATNGNQAAYQTECRGRSLTLAPGTSGLLSDCTGARFAQATLQISHPAAMSRDTLTLTIISQ